MWLRVEVARGGFIWFDLIGTMPQDPETKDCHDFANLVDKIAQKDPNQSAAKFVGALMDRFGEISKEFDSDGFKKEFRDPNGSPNQARHYVGGLLAGFAGHLLTRVDDFGATVAWFGSALITCFSMTTRHCQTKDLLSIVGCSRSWS